MADNTVVRDETAIVRDIQRLIRREMDRRGISVKAVQFDGGWDHSSTVMSYFPADEYAEPKVMSIAAFRRLFGALPLDLLSLLMPDGHVVVKAPEMLDHDEVSEAIQDWLKAKERAHHPDSPAGRDIAPCEDETLRHKFTVVAGGRG